MFGREDIDVIAPVVEGYRAAGMDVTGPVPADTIYVKALAGQFDAWSRCTTTRATSWSRRWASHGPEERPDERAPGVNVSLGLPIVRTSVDHGTAFDIAGKGIANARA